MISRGVFSYTETDQCSLPFPAAFRISRRPTNSTPNSARASERAALVEPIHPAIHDAGAGRTRTGRDLSRSQNRPASSHLAQGDWRWRRARPPYKPPPFSTHSSLFHSLPSSSRHSLHPKNLTRSRRLALASSPRRREGRAHPRAYITTPAGAEVPYPSLIRSPRSASVPRLRHRRVGAIPPRPRLAPAP